jgi:hypothetical protein
MPVIAQRSFVLAPTTDKCLRLAGEEFTRTLDLTGIPANWLRIRIAINCALADTGGGNISNSFLFMGMCSGTTYPFGSQQTLHAVGFFFNNTGGTWTYNAGAGNPYYSTTTFSGTRKVGINYSGATSGSLTSIIPTTTGTIKRRGWLSSTIYQIDSTQVAEMGHSQSATTAAGDVWYEHFLYATNQTYAPYILESAGAGSGNVTQVPGAGWNTNPLNTVDIYWSDTTYALEIYAIAVEITT